MSSVSSVFNIYSLAVVLQISLVFATGKQHDFQSGEVSDRACLIIPLKTGSIRRECVDIEATCRALACPSSLICAIQVDHEAVCLSPTPAFLRHCAPETTRLLAPCPLGYHVLGFGQGCNYCSDSTDASTSSEAQQNTLLSDHAMDNSVGNSKTVPQEILLASKLQKQIYSPTKKARSSVANCRSLEDITLLAGKLPMLLGIPRNLFNSETARLSSEALPVSQKLPSRSFKTLPIDHEGDRNGEEVVSSEKELPFETSGGSKTGHFQPPRNPTTATQSKTNFKSVLLIENTLDKEKNKVVSATVSSSNSQPLVESPSKPESSEIEQSKEPWTTEPATSVSQSAVTDDLPGDSSQYQLPSESSETAGVSTTTEVSVPSTTTPKFADDASSTASDVNSASDGRKPVERACVVIYILDAVFMEECVDISGRCADRGCPADTVCGADLASEVGCFPKSVEKLKNCGTEEFRLSQPCPQDSGLIGFGMGCTFCEPGNAFLGEHQDRFSTAPATTPVVTEILLPSTVLSVEIKPSIFPTAAVVFEPNTDDQTVSSSSQEDDITIASATPTTSDEAGGTNSASSSLIADQTSPDTDVEFSTSSTTDARIDDDIEDVLQSDTDVGEGGAVGVTVPTVISTSQSAGLSGQNSLNPDGHDDFSEVSSVYTTESSKSPEVLDEVDDVVSTTQHMVASAEYHNLTAIDSAPLATGLEAGASEDGPITNVEANSVGSASTEPTSTQSSSSTDLPQLLDISKPAVTDDLVSVDNAFSEVVLVTEEFTGKPATPADRSSTASGTDIEAVPTTTESTQNEIESSTSSPTHEGTTDTAELVTERACIVIHVGDGEFTRKCIDINADCKSIDCPDDTICGINLSSNVVCFEKKVEEFQNCASEGFRLWQPCPADSGIAGFGMGCTFCVGANPFENEVLPPPTLASPSPSVPSDFSPENIGRACVVTRGVYGNLKRTCCDISSKCAEANCPSDTVCGLDLLERTRCFPVAVREFENCASETFRLDHPCPAGSRIIGFGMFCTFCQRSNDPAEAMAPQVPSLMIGRACIRRWTRKGVLRKGCVSINRLCDRLRCPWDRVCALDSLEQPACFSPGYLSHANCASEKLRLSDPCPRGQVVAAFGAGCTYCRAAFALPPLVETIPARACYVSARARRCVDITTACQQLDCAADTCALDVDGDARCFRREQLTNQHCGPEVDRLDQPCPQGSFAVAFGSGCTFCRAVSAEYEGRACVADGGAGRCFSISARCVRLACPRANECVLNWMHNLVCYPKHRLIHAFCGTEAERVHSPCGALNANKPLAYGMRCNYCY